jgi:hypothetical protein
MNTQRFFLSEVDGNLYRDDKAIAFRHGIAKWHSKIKTVADLKATIRAADRAFGCYDLVLFTDDGATLCSKCARSEFRQIAEAIRDKDSSGWRAIGASMDNELDPCNCDHCNAVIVEGELDEEPEGEESDHNDDFVDSDPWRGGPEGDLYG